MNLSKIKKIASKVYPPRLEWDWKDEPYDPNEEKRKAFIKGYLQSENDDMRIAVACFITSIITSIIIMIIL